MEHQNNVYFIETISSGQKRANFKSRTPDTETEGLLSYLTRAYAVLRKVVVDL